MQENISDCASDEAAPDGVESRPVVGIMHPDPSSATMCAAGSVFSQVVILSPCPLDMESADGTADGAVLAAEARLAQVQGV